MNLSRYSLFSWLLSSSLSFVSALDMMNAFWKLWQPKIKSIWVKGKKKMLRFFKMACLGSSSQPILTYIGFIIHRQGYWHAEVGIRLLKDKRTEITFKLGIFRMKRRETKHQNSLHFLKIKVRMLNKLIYKNYILISLSTEFICSG